MSFGSWFQGLADFFLLKKRPGLGLEQDKHPAWPTAPGHLPHPRLLAYPRPSRLPVQSWSCVSPRRRPQSCRLDHLDSTRLNHKQSWPVSQLVQVSSSGLGQITRILNSLANENQVVAFQSPFYLSITTWHPSNPSWKCNCGKIKTLFKI